MRKLQGAVLAVMLAGLTGCTSVASRYPLFPENAKEVVFDPALLGRWQDPEDDNRIYQVTRLNESSYAIEWKEDGKSVIATVQLLKVRGVLLANAAVIDANDSEHYFTRHFLAKVRTEPDKIQVAAMSTQWLIDRIVATGKPAHDPAEEGSSNLVLTAPSAELRKYLLPYADRPEAFEKETELHRVK
jgi:hypothetical protein